MAEKTVATNGQNQNAPSREGTRSQERYVTPPVDIYETAGGLVVKADLPGVEKENLDLQVESNLLTPRLIGKRVNLHPVWVIFSLLAFSNLFGLLGLLIAVPVAAIIGVLTRFALQRYLASPIYDPVAAAKRDDISIRL